MVQVQTTIERQEIILVPKVYHFVTIKSAASEHLVIVLISSYFVNFNLKLTSRLSLFTLGVRLKDILWHGGRERQNGYARS